MEPEHTGQPEQPEPPGTALVITQEAVPISVSRIDDERTPEGMVCLGTNLADRIVARCVVSPEAAGFLDEADLFQEPVRLALAAQEAPPGLQCRLFALVNIPREVLEDDEPEAEPWAASVPSWEAEQAAQEDQAAHELAAVLLGHIVRFSRDRRHPESLALEARDVLTTIVQRGVTEVVDKVLEDLLGEGDADPA